ncbi:tyrosine-type recombinase/integrase [Kitasatospora sp. NPDC001309]|uniref:tyrosine-type recombinase/integrase n=2 Tax=unclassified Kitasatospora TaxID=2633591 RepID=UPI0036C722EE
MPDHTQLIPMGVDLTTDIEHRPDRRPQFRYRARVRWTDPNGGGRKSASSSVPTEEEAEAWITRMQRAAARGITPKTLTMTLADYGDENWDLAMRGLETTTLDPYTAGWKLRVTPVLGHIPVTSITNGITDRALHSWIADGLSISSVKNSLAPLVRIMEQAVRDGLINFNPSRMSGWQRLYKKAEDELDDPRSLALADWDALDALANALVERSHNHYRGWGDIVRFAACTAARIGEVSGVRVKDINRFDWTWDLCRQTTTGPGGLIDKGTKGKRRRTVPIIEEIRDLVSWRITVVGNDPMARLFTGPRGGRITTAILRDATHWDEVVVGLGYEYLRRHDLRHTGLTWLADAGVPIHVLQKIAGHGHITTTQRYLHPDKSSIEKAGRTLSKHLSVDRGNTQVSAFASPASAELPTRHLRLVQ